MNMHIMGSPHAIFTTFAGVGSAITSAASRVWNSVSAGVSRLFLCFSSTTREPASIDTRVASVTSVAQSPMAAPQANGRSGGQGLAASEFAVSDTSGNASPSGSEGPVQVHAPTLPETKASSPSTTLRVHDRKDAPDRPLTKADRILGVREGKNLNSTELADYRQSLKAANAAHERQRALESLPRMSPPAAVSLDLVEGLVKAGAAGDFFARLIGEGHEHSTDGAFLRGEHKEFTDLRKFLATSIEPVAACAIDAGVDVMRAMPGRNLELRKDEIDDWVVAFKTLPAVLEKSNPITPLPADAREIVNAAGNLIKGHIQKAISSNEREPSIFGDLPEKATERVLSDFVLLRSMGPMSAKFLGQDGHRQIVSKAAQIMLAAAQRSFLLDGRFTAEEQEKPENQEKIAQVKAAHAEAHAALHKWFANANRPSAPKDSKG